MIRTFYCNVNNMILLSFVRSVINLDPNRQLENHVGLYKLPTFKNHERQIMRHRLKFLHLTIKVVRNVLKISCATFDTVSHIEKV